MELPVRCETCRYWSGPCKVRKLADGLLFTSGTGDVPKPHACRRYPSPQPKKPPTEWCGEYSVQP